MTKAGFPSSHGCVPLIWLLPLLYAYVYVNACVCVVHVYGYHFFGNDVRIVGAVHTWVLRLAAAWFKRPLLWNPTVSFWR